MPISLPSYLVSIWTGNWKAFSKNLLSQVCVNSSYHLFSVLSINADHTVARHSREQGVMSTSRENGGTVAMKKGSKIQININMQVSWDGNQR